MRKMLLVFLFPFPAYAQYLTDSVNLKSFLFEKFMMGTVLMKSGVVKNAFLNYNTEDQSMVFIQEGQYMHFADIDAVDTIYLQQKKFVAIDKTIYQIVNEAAPVSLLITFTNKIHPFVATSDHDGTSKQPESKVSNTVSNVYVNRNFKGDYSVEILRQYWIARNDKPYKVTSKRKFLSQFPSKERTAIQKYIAKNNIDLTNELDLVKLVGFCNTEVQ